MLGRRSTRQKRSLSASFWHMGFIEPFLNFLKKSILNIFKKKSEKNLDGANSSKKITKKQI
jgi:hypothetical protein